MSTKTQNAQERAHTYIRPVANNRLWWLKHRRYLSYMLRELSVIFVAAFLVIYLVQIAFLTSGPQKYNSFLNLMENPGWIIMHVVFFAFALLHSITWFNLMAAVTPVKIGGQELPRWAIWLAGLALWIAVSVVIAVIVLIVA